MKEIKVGWLVSIGRDDAGRLLMRCKCNRVIAIEPRKVSLAKYNNRRLRCRPCTKMMIKIYRKHQWKMRRANGETKPRRAFIEHNYTAPALIDSLSISVDVGIKGDV